MNIKLADVFWILMNKVDEIVIYIDDNANSIIDYMTMNIKYIGRDQNYNGSLIFRVVLSEKEI